MMQINSIVLYNNKGEIRKLDFKLNHVNLITGDLNTGKSALIPIINYCLGCSDFNDIPEGIIRDSVAWYGVLYQLDDKQIFIAKPKPEYGVKQDKASYIVDIDFTIPKYKSLIINSTDIAIKKDLSALLRQSLGLPQATDEQLESLKIGIEYTRPYLFQRKEEVVTGDVIFYKQRDNFKAIKDSLPYFLGAKKEEDLTLQKEYQNKCRELQKIKSSLNEYKDKEKEIKNFFVQAQQLELIEKDLFTETMSLEQIVNRIRAIDDSKTPTSLELPKDFEPQLRAELNRLNHNFNDIVRQLNALKSYDETVDDYSKEAKEQQMRLKSIGLFETKKGETNNIFSNEKHCPLCHNSVDNIPSISAIHNALLHLNNNLNNANNDKVNITSKVEELEKIKKQLWQERTKIEDELRYLAKNKKLQADFTEKERIHLINVARLTTRIEDFFKNQVHFNKNQLEHQQKMLSIECERIKSKINSFENKCEHKINIFNDHISSFASKIDLSYQGRYDFKIENINITVSDENYSHSISMKSMGGDLNKLGCHLITLLELHRCFIKEKRPVPNFLILDQTIQSYSSSEDIIEHDKINKMILLILEISKETGLQVILTAHKDEELTQKDLYYVDENWTSENALIPISWIQ
ncbi:MAG: DUF3732 domain-containing protein [Methylococcaceae bacterium]